MRWLLRLLVALGLWKAAHAAPSVPAPSRRSILVTWAKRAAMILAPLGALGAVAVVSGVVPIAASSGHWAITEWFLHFAMGRSVATHSMGIEAPSLDDERLVLAGAGHYEHGCRFCHGAPGDPMPPVAASMTPKPPKLASRVGKYDDAELFYIVKHGVKLTGMPAWPEQKRDDEVWAMVAFLRRLPRLDAVGYEGWAIGPPVDPGDAPAVVLRKCARCHGVDGLSRGKGAFPRLAGQRPEYLRSALEAYAKGTRYSGTMRPLAAAMLPSELHASVEWYASRPRPVVTSSTTNLAGESIALRGIPERKIPPCARCHGPNASRRYPAYPRLAGQYASYLEQQLQLFYQGLRGGAEFADVMQTVAEHALEPQEIRAVAAYYSTLESDVLDPR